MGDFEPVGAKPQRQVDHVLEPAEILPVDDRVDRQWQSGIAHQLGRAVLLGLCTGQPGDPIALTGIGILQTELDMFETRPGESRHSRSVEPDTGGDQIAIKAGLSTVGDEADEIAANQRLATGEMHLQNAECCRLAQHPSPGRGVELGARPLQRQWVRAIRAAQRAAMGQLGKQR